MMFPWLGQIPGLQQGQGDGMDIMSLIRMLQQRGQQQGKMPMQRPQFDWSNPMASFGQRFAQGPVMDNQGLSRLWSTQVGQPTQGPMGWNTQTNRAQSPIGGLLGRIGSMFG